VSLVVVVVASLVSTSTKGATIMRIITNDWQGELTNACTCMDYDGETDTYTPATECGDCYDDALYVFKYDLGEWFTNNEDGWWQVNGLPLWNRNVSGVFRAIPNTGSPRLHAGGSVAKVVDFSINPRSDIAEFVRGITVSGEWNLRYRLDGDILLARLSHHDVPMGKPFTVTYGTNPDE